MAGMATAPADPPGIGITLGKDGVLMAEPATGATAREGVYAGGGVSVVHAMAAGKRAATAIDAYLTKRRSLLAVPAT